MTSTPRDHRPHIALKHGSASEHATRAQLERLFERYDLSPWFFTDAIEIDDDAIPHSAPVLTLHTRHLRDDQLLLSTYIHEQSHRYFSQRREQTERAVVALKAIFPTLPVGFPDGADDLENSYIHLLVISFEQNGMRRLTGELQTREVMEFWTTDHYRVLYRLVLDQGAKVWPIMKTAGLEPPHA